MVLYPLLSIIEIYGYEYISKIIDTIKNLFLKDLLKHVKKLFNTKIPDNFCDFICEHIFYNKNICINNKTVYLKNWVDNNVTKIAHITKDDGSFLTFDEFRRKYQNVRTNFVTYNGIIRSINEYLRKLDISREQIDVQDQEPVGRRILRGSKHIIKSSLSKKPNMHASIAKWNNNFQNLEWPKIFSICHKTTVDTKLRWFQMRLIYRILPTNRFLFLRKIKTSEICHLCRNYAETIEHMLFDCVLIGQFWQNLKTNFIDKLPHVNMLNISKELVLFGRKQNVQTDKPLNLFILAAKYYIYSCKFTNSIPNANIYLKLFKYRYSIEKNYHQNILNNTFDLMWLPYKTVIENL